MQALGSSDVCALFLLSVESREAGKAINLENGAERAASLLSRFFRITDIVGYLGENRFAAFLTGHLTGSVVWEKATTLSEALWFATEQTPAETIESYVGVYVFRAYDDEFKAIFRKAEYALEMAHKDANRRFYIYTMPGTEPAFFRAASESFSSQMLRSYIDEGVRLIEVGGAAERRLHQPRLLPPPGADGRRRRARSKSTPSTATPTSATWPRPRKRAAPWRAATASPATGPHGSPAACGCCASPRRRAARSCWKFPTISPALRN